MRARACIASFAVDGPLGSCEMDSLGMNGDGRPTLSVAAGKAVYFLDAERPNQLIKKIDVGREVASVAVNGPAGRFVVGVPGDTWVRVWEFEGEGREVGRFET
jgi:serine-threonine kinase receptor-associated protein